MDIPIYKAVLVFFQIVIAAGWLRVAALWMQITIGMLVVAYVVPKETHLIFPLFKKGGEERFSGSAFWVFLVIPSCLLLMFTPVAFPGRATLAMAKQGIYWTAITGAIVAVFTNYYLNHRNRGPGFLQNLGGLFGSHGGKDAASEPQGRPLTVDQHHQGHHQGNP